MNKLNELLQNNNYDYNYSLIELTRHIDDFPVESRKDILYNLGGVINHNIYFASMSPNKVKPNKLLLEKIEKDFGSYENFKNEFIKKALEIKGSGYTFLVLNNGQLEIVNLKNQDNPYSYGYIPLIGVDMWEHAYFINYENYKESYLNNFFEIVDFSEANKIFNEV